jgi:LacI family transcriptional regulator
VKPSIKQLSVLTGYSPATISNALNNKLNVNQETVNKIWKAARETGYINENSISSIRLTVCRTHGEVVNDTPFFSALISGVENECRALGFATIISHLDKADPNFDRLLKQILSDRTAANLVLATELTEDDAKIFLNSMSPIVLVDTWFEDMDFDTVGIDNTDSTFKAVTYLINCGHKRIGYLKSNTSINNFLYRGYGYRRAMNRNGLEILSKHTVLLTPSMDGSYKDMKKYLAEKTDLPTAFFADNDNIALGACKALQDCGYRIPEDISVIGFDDMPFCEIATPPLTTVRVFKQVMGAEAVRRLVQVIRSEKMIKVKTQICTEFIERESVRNISD